jgi:outer membrane protein insertion porin family
MFGNITLELRKYHAGFFKKNTFAYRVVGGIMTDSTKEGQRFWVGGGSTLRGYDGGFYKGTKKLVGTIENRTQLNDILGFVVFFDAGRAWDYRGRDLSYQHDDSFANDIAMAAGVGLRINTPIGPLRFDFGWPIRNDDTSGMEFYFNMGQSF